MGAAGGHASSRAGVRNKRRFAFMDCPFLHAYDRTKNRNQRGEIVDLTVPGMKKHVKQVHGEDAYMLVKWPPIHQGSPVFRKAPAGTIAAMSINELRQEAARVGIDPRGLSRKELGREIIRAM